MAPGVGNLLMSGEGPAGTEATEMPLGLGSDRSQREAGLQAHSLSAGSSCGSFSLYEDSYKKAL